MKKPLAISASVLGALVLALSGCGGTDSGSTDTGGSTPTQSSAPSETAASETPSSDAAQGGTTFKDGVLTTPRLKIEITDHKVIPAGKKGNEYGKKPVLALWYKTTNVSGDDTDPSTAFIFAFTAYQDNNPNAENKLEVGSLPDDRFLDTQVENIKKGGTVENAIAYELDDLTTPVDLVASDPLGDEEYGRMTYPVK